MPQRTVLIAGSTGLVGKEILLGLLADNTVTRIHSLVRRNQTIEHAKLTSHVVDFNHLPALPLCDEVYLALGTTIKVAGSQAAFRAVDFDANLAVAKAALAAGAKTLGLVSAMGADAGSSVFYSRVKGELEEALAALPYKGVVFARPSLLAGDRQGLGQPTRQGEELGFAVSKAIGFLIPRNYRPIEAAAVAKALLKVVPTAAGKVVLLSGAMR
ncbi:MAG TPA: nucleoside-diphosphate sugar epimerase [Burkholderiaceae bacterium]|jgi:uncharacterized protein YbjT (DUF2867 family)